MPKLTEPVKVFIVQRLACFEEPREVIAQVNETYGVAVTPQMLQKYDPTKVNGQDLSKKLKTIFEDTRARFLEDTSDIPIASKAYRLRMLQKMAQTAMARGNAPLAASLMEQAAKEVGEAYTNKREITGKGGGPIEQVVRTEVMSDSELDARIRELEGKLHVSSRRQS